MKAFAPVGNRVLVRPADPEEKRGSLFLPSQSQQAPSIGTVIAVGEGLRREDGTTMPLVVRQGDKILYSPYAVGTQVELYFVKHLLIEEKDIFGIVYE